MILSSIIVLILERWMMGKERHDSFLKSNVCDPLLSRKTQRWTGPPLLSLTETGNYVDQMTNFSESFRDNSKKQRLLYRRSVSLSLRQDVLRLCFGFPHTGPLSDVCTTPSRLQGKQCATEKESNLNVYLLNTFRKKLLCRCLVLVFTTVRFQSAMLGKCISLSLQHNVFSFFVFFCTFSLTCFSSTLMQINHRNVYI